jgi:choline-sulfatase
LFLNLFDVHDPYDQGAQYRHLFTESTEDHRRIDAIFNSIQKNPENRYEINRLPAADVKHAWAMYLAELRWLDSQVQVLLNELQKRDLINNTVIVFTSDHGDEFLEHGGVFHSDTLFNELIRMPLFVYAPGRIAASRIDTPVSTIDIFPTVLEMLGVQQPVKTDARSFMSLVFPQPAEDQGGYAARPLIAERFGRSELVESHLYSVIDYPWKLILSVPERPRIPHGLFNLAEDPREQNNLFHEFPDKVSELTQVLEGTKLFEQYGRPKLEASTNSPERTK